MKGFFWGLAFALLAGFGLGLAYAWLVSPLRVAVEKALAPYKDGTPVYWVQEEPENMGAWWYMRIHFGEKLLGRYPFSVVARGESASPATGSHKSHHNEQHKILNQAFAGL